MKKQTKTRTERSRSIPQGYKPSPFGPIPTDWDTHKLGEICENIMVGIASAATHAYRSEGVVMFRNQNIKENQLEDGDVLFIDREYEKSHKNKRLKGGDILIARTGYPGTACVVPNNYNGAQSFTTLIARPKTIKVNSEFLCQYINSEIGQGYFSTNQIGGGQKNVNAGTLEQMPIPLPSMKEQLIILNLLNTWDKAIQSTTQLIEQKQNRKKWLMQMLLTGKKRLKGFEKEKWEKINIGELIKESRIPSINNAPDKRITVKLNLKGIEKREVRGTESEDATAYFIRKKGQFIYGKQNLHKGAFGIIPDELDNFESSQDIPTFDFTNLIAPRYFLYFMSQEGFYTSLEKISTGTGSKRIHPEELYKVVIKIPSNKEQIEIANLLDKSAKEIDLMVQKLGSLKEQKKGLMQILLTGKKRLKI